MKTLYISDLDGTLLNPQAELSMESYELLKQLISSGIHFTCATARTATTTTNILHGLQLSAPAVLMNGVAILDWTSNRYVKVEYLNRDFYQSCIQKFREFHLTSFVYCIEQNKLSCYYENLINSAMAEFKEVRVTRYQKPFYKVDSFSLLFPGNVAYILLLERKETLQPFCDWLNSVRAQFDIDFCFYPEIYLKDTWCLEIFSSKASKYNAVQFIRNNYGYDHIIGFGDNLNDLSLFQACDEAYAVGNAKEEVKTAAKAVLGRNDENSVPLFIQKLEQDHS